MNETELQPKVAPKLPFFYKISNPALFRNTRDGGEFYCHLCGKFRPRSKFLYDIFKDNERACWLANNVTCAKTRHIKMNYRALIRKYEGNPEKQQEISTYYGKKALGMLLIDKSFIAFCLKNNITDKDALLLKDIGDGLRKLIGEKLKVVLKWK